MEQLSSNNTVSTAIITISLIIIVIAITSVIAIWQYPKFVSRNLQQFPTNKGFCFKTLHEREVDNEGEQLQSQERQSEQLLSHGQRWGAKQRCNAFGSKGSNLISIVNDSSPSFLELHHAYTLLSLGVKKGHLILKKIQLSLQQVETISQN
ncbi:uncharacterized protein LOC112568660 [Pomacea canaliculata]|uniref:uncharacterized protein LOC112568660 n=1 Tax=Pomacea canaliculata TaxID=400727 RepID=UPI000D725BD0|nr:uncharacterized protein LOC112568660 [Pomacea canaliculata]